MDPASPAIVNLASVAALNGMPQRALYGASKGAVLALTDVEALLRSQENRQTLETSLRSLLSQPPDLLLAVSPEGRPIFVSASALADARGVQEIASLRQLAGQRGGRGRVDAGMRPIARLHHPVAGHL